MLNKKLRKIVAVMLIAVTITGCSTATPGKAPAQNQTEKNAEKSENEGVTTGQLADYFIRASEGYVSQVDRTELLEGLKESERANRLQMLVIAGRAFGKLPEPKGNAKRIAPPSFDLTEVPAWAKEELKNLSNGGILASSDLENEADNFVTIKDAQILAERFYSAFGTNLKDDFYTAVNQQQLSTLEIPKDSETAGGSSTVTANTDEQLKNLILEVVNSTESYPKDSPEQKIQALYKNFENMEARNQAGIEPLQKYLDAVDRANDFSELNAAIAQAVLELGNAANGLIPGIPVTDPQDSSRKVLQLMTQVPGLMKSDYEDPDSEAYKKYRDGLVEQLIAVGESSEEAKRHADGIMAIEKNLAENIEEQDDSGKIKIQQHYTLEMLDEMMPQAKLSQLMTAIGLKSDVKMLVFDDKQFAAYAKWFTEENLELFKAIEKMALLTGYSGFLSDGLAEKFGTAGIPSADIAIQNYLSDELGQIYTERYFPEESKKDMEKMVSMLMDTFNERIQRLEWMEDATKREALKKLDSLTVLIGYPDEWMLNKAEIRGPEEGDSYFENVTASEVVKWKRQLEELEQPVDPHRFPLAAYTVNAAANRTTNTLIFPAGILQAPFYDKNASFETNLGAIGSTIAHEITHIFDDGGAQYDAQGNLNDWWAEEDYAHFQGLCKKVVEFYDGREAAPGVKANGKDNLSENIADIGGIACGLEILSKMENPDYDAFFRSYANQWLRVADYDTLAELAQTDMHAPNKLRCNLVLANFQEFYDTYEIKETDGMYVAPKDRIKIW